jgi:hypothetical protein
VNIVLMTPHRMLRDVVTVLLLALATGARAATLNVRDFKSPAAAFAAAHDGDRIYFPSPGPYAAPAGGFVISKSLEIFGDGPGRGVDGASSIVPDRDGNAFVLDSTVSVPNVHLHDLLVIRTGNAAGTRAALRTTRPDDGSSKVVGLRLERVSFVNVGGDAIRLDGGAQSAVLLVTISDCEINSAGGSGIVLVHTTTTSIMNGYVHGCRDFGLYAEAAGVHLFGVAFEANQLGGTSNDHQPQVRLKLCHGFAAIGCHFEAFADDARAARTALSIENCWGGEVTSCVFVKNGGGVPGSRGVLILGGSRDIDVGANSWTYVDTLVAVRGAASNPGCTVRAQTPLKTDARAAGIVQSAPQQR